MGTGWQTGFPCRNVNIIETHAKGLPSLTASQDTKKDSIKLSGTTVFRYQTVTTTSSQVDQWLQKSSYLLHNLEGTSFDIFLCFFSSSAHMCSSRHPSSSLLRLSLRVKEGTVVSATKPKSAENLSFISSKDFSLHRPAGDLGNRDSIGDAQHSHPWDKTTLIPPC